MLLAADAVDGDLGCTSVKSVPEVWISVSLIHILYRLPAHYIYAYKHSLTHTHAERERKRESKREINGGR